MNYGFSFKLIGRDLAFENGDFVYVEGLPNLVQGLVVTLTTRQGEDFMHDLHGLPFYTLFQSDSGFGDQVRLLEASIRTTILIDDRVESVADVQVDYTTYASSRRWDVSATSKVVGETAPIIVEAVI